MRKNVWRYAAVGVIPVVVLLNIAFGFAQTILTVKNPKEGNADAIRSGTTMYRVRCAGCHGPEARGAAGGAE